MTRSRSGPPLSGERRSQGLHFFGAALQCSASQRAGGAGSPRGIRVATSRPSRFLMRVSGDQVRKSRDQFSKIFGAEISLEEI